MSFRPTRTCAAPAADAASPSRVSLALSALLKTSQYPSLRATKTFSRCVGDVCVQCCMQYCVPLLVLRNLTRVQVIICVVLCPCTHTDTLPDAITLTASIPLCYPHVPPQACCASSTIPLFTHPSFFPPRFRGIRIIDGGLTNNTPIFLDGARRQIVVRLRYLERREKRRAREKGVLGWL